MQRDCCLWQSELWNCSLPYGGNSFRKWFWCYRCWCNISKSDKYSALKPAYIAKLCVQCGKCAENCPIGLLSPDTGMYLSEAAKNQCIGCMACVSSCMQKARVAEANPIVRMVMKKKFRQASRERKEPLTIVV
ncbi:MAG: 4Fe-4S binding protein [Deltaproteobacteria bacterium]|nr:4Fe-4S binding protein [Deltaproteobacteria bacterium]